MKKILLSFALFTLVVGGVSAQSPFGNWLKAASVEMRADWQGNWAGTEKLPDESGFRGKFLNLKLSGDLGRYFSYNYRQRFSKEIASGFFNATDYINVDFHPTEKWSVTAGKMPVPIGGFEYYYAPIDVYRYTEFCNNISCYQFGLQGAYKPTKHDAIELFAGQSIFRQPGADLYGFSARYHGTHGFYEALHSVGMFEYAHNLWINYIALGNTFNFSHGHFILDYTNRYASGYDASFFGDFTLSAELHVQPIKELNVFAKYSFDYNKENAGDLLVLAGTEQHSIGGGVEYFPIHGRQDLRLHAAYTHHFGEPVRTIGGFADDGNFLTVGVTFRADLLNLKKQFTRN